jgi:deoxyinosine 3'endonuclease (endonuclease V)
MMERIMSGTKNWVMGVEEVFWTSVTSIVKTSYTLNEAVERSVSLGKSMVPYIDTEIVEDTVYMINMETNSHRCLE